MEATLAQVNFFLQILDFCLRLGELQNLFTTLLHHSLFLRPGFLSILLSLQSPIHEVIISIWEIFSEGHRLNGNPKQLHRLAHHSCKNILALASLYKGLRTICPEFVKCRSGDLNFWQQHRQYLWASSSFFYETTSLRLVAASVAEDPFDVLALFEDSCLWGSTPICLSVAIEAAINFSPRENSDRNRKTIAEPPSSVAENLCFFLGTSSTLFFPLSIKGGHLSPS